jgi:TetR/AcrR family transcriptional regulator, transcriptional repressor of aconitase
MSRQASRNLTRQRLRNSAQQIFAREGIGAASIDRIAEAAGYSRGAFYSNYPDKHTLALELLAEWQSSEIALWKAKLEDVDDPERRIEMLRDSFNNFHSDADRSLLNLELQLEAERSEAFGERYRAYLDVLHTGIAELLTILFKMANRKPPADLHLLARTMRSTTMGLALQGRYAPRGDGSGDPGTMLALFVRAMINLGAPLEPIAEEI